MTSNERQFTAEEAEAWQPGDPLYNSESYAYLYNFRDDPPLGEPGMDAASWPVPAFSADLGREACGVEAFITRERRVRDERGDEVA